MAASNAPKHDFAPSWLKIPNSNENTRPVGSRNSHAQDRSHQHDYYTRYNGDYPRPLNRQNSFDMYDGSRRYSPSKFRHHSMEDDYYVNYYNYAPYPLGYNDYPMQFRSQPSLPRQDLKYSSASSSRFGQVNGSYNGIGPVCDFFPSGEGFNGFGHSAKRSHYARDGRTESRESRDSDRSQRDGGEEDKMFKDDFPSLNGTNEDGDVKMPKNTSSGGVWDNPPKSKVEETSEVKNSGSGIYKVVPTKAESVRKNSRDGIRVNGREGSPLAAIKPKASREAQQQSPTQSMEILSTRLMRPKPVDKKSEFLKALRKEVDGDASLHNGHQETSSQEARKEGEEEEAAEVVMNGVDILQLEGQHPPTSPPNRGGRPYFSSTVEEELTSSCLSCPNLCLAHEENCADSGTYTYRFMRSLGWDETEEPEEITEDEKLEFLRKSMVQQQQQRNGRSRVLPKAWSPQHLKSASPPQPLTPLAQDMDEAASSSESDEDA
ncbi:hypothetical protein ACOMHN_013470 [Nucella lapillus]